MWGRVVDVVGGQLTDVGRDAGHDDLLLARRLDRGAEVGVVPRVDFALASDVRCVWVHFGDLFWEGAVGA